MKHIFFCNYHKNIFAKHKTTFEFTKDDYLTPNGDCIIGIEADFDYEKLKKILNSSEIIAIIIETGSQKIQIKARSNKYFTDKHEIVVRKSKFTDYRTLATEANLAANDMDRKFFEEFKNTGRMKVTIKSYKDNNDN